MCGFCVSKKLYYSIELFAFLSTRRCISSISGGFGVASTHWPSPPAAVRCTTTRREDFLTFKLLRLNPVVHQLAEDEGGG